MIQTDTRYYVRQIKDKYPQLHENEINRLCLYFIRQVFGHARNNRDMLFVHKERGHQLKIYAQDFDVQRNHKKAARQKRWLLKKRRERQDEKKAD
jgi:hypothetical protein